HAELSREIAGRTGGRNLDVRHHREIQFHHPLCGRTHSDEILGREMETQKARKRATADLIQFGKPPSRSMAIRVKVLTARTAGSRDGSNAAEISLVRDSAMLFMDSPLIRWAIRRATPLPPMPSQLRAS